MGSATSAWKAVLCYEGEIVQHDQEAAESAKDRRRLIRQDLEAEITAEKRLIQLGFRSGYSSKIPTSGCHPTSSPKSCELTNEGWHVEAEGKLYRTSGALSIEITSGVDWFGLEGGAQFGDTGVALPRLLRAIKQGEQTVRLDDGTLGIIPEEWMKKYGILAGLASEGNICDSPGRRRDCWMPCWPLSRRCASTPSSSACAKLRSFAGVRAAEPTADFAGELRANARRAGLALFSPALRFRRRVCR